MDLKSIRARCSESVTDMVSSPSEYYRSQQILRDRADLLAEVDRLLGFAQHKRDCNAWPYKLLLDGFEPDPADCTCGLTPRCSCPGGSPKSPLGAHNMCPLHGLNAVSASPEQT
jgi:hypothetical protein